MPRRPERKNEQCKKINNCIKYMYYDTKDKIDYTLYLHLPDISIVHYNSENQILQLYGDFTKEHEEKKDTVSELINRVEIKGEIVTKILPIIKSSNIYLKEE